MRSPDVTQPGTGSLGTTTSVPGRRSNVPVPVELPDPSGVEVDLCAGVLVSMAAEALRVQSLFTGHTSAPGRPAAVASAAAAGDLATAWLLAVPEICAAHRAAALSAGDAADRGEDDVFGSLAELCAHLMSWLAWCSRLPFGVPTALPTGEPVLAYRLAARGGGQARTAVAAFTEVLAARRWPAARRPDATEEHARGR